MNLELWKRDGTVFLPNDTLIEMTNNINFIYITVTSSEIKAPLNLYSAVQICWLIKSAEPAIIYSYRY